MTSIHRMPESRRHHPGVGNVRPRIPSSPAKATLRTRSSPLPAPFRPARHLPHDLRAPGAKPMAAADRPNPGPTPPGGRNALTLRPESNPQEPADLRR